jgi:hypothetical protein
MAVDHLVPAVGTACTGGIRPRAPLARSGNTQRSSAGASALDRSVGKRSRLCERRGRRRRCRRRLLRDTPAPISAVCGMVFMRKSTWDARSHSTEFRARMSMRTYSDRPHCAVSASILPSFTPSAGARVGYAPRNSRAHISIYP